MIGQSVQFSAKNGLFKNCNTSTSIILQLSIFLFGIKIVGLIENDLTNIPGYVFHMKQIGSFEN